jgi:hypothetical protein
VRRPDAVDVLRGRHDELLEVLSWTDMAVVEVYRTSVRHHPTAVGLTPFPGDLMDPFLDPIGRTMATGGVLTPLCFGRSRT